MITPSGVVFRAQSSSILNASSDGVSSLLLGYHLTVKNSLQSKTAVVPPHGFFFFCAFFPAFCFVFPQSIFKSLEFNSKWLQSAWKWLSPAESEPLPVGELVSRALTLSCVPPMYPQMHDRAANKHTHRTHTYNIHNLKIYRFTFWWGNKGPWFLDNSLIKQLQKSTTNSL